MKVETQNGQLTLKQPALLFLVPLGGLFIAIATLAGVLTASKTHLACDPTVCQLSTHYLVLIPPSEQTLPLETIASARVQRQRSSSSSGGSSTTYRVVLDTANGSFPVGAVATSNRGGKERQAAAINQFLANPQAEFELIQNDYWFGLVFFFAFGSPGLILAALGTTSTTRTLDRLFGKLIVTHQGLWGKRCKERSLAEFTGVSINKAISQGRSRRSRSRVYYQVDLEGVGQPAMLASGSLEQMRTLATEVQTYLGYREIREPLGSSLAEAFKPMALVRLLLIQPSKRAEQIEQYRQHLHSQPQDRDTHRKLVLTLIVNGNRELALAHLQSSRAEFAAQGWRTEVFDQIEREVAAIPGEMLRRFEKPNSGQ